VDRLPVTSLLEQNLALGVAEPTPLAQRELDAAEIQLAPRGSGADGATLTGTAL
jgi:hypothetical protein